MATSRITQSLSLQAGACTALGSPFSGAILEAAARDVEAGGPALALTSPWAELGVREQMEAAMPLRLLGALHDLALSGDAPELSAAYPSPGRTSDPQAAWAAALSAMASFTDRMARFMDHEPQTNEVRRSICLAPGFLTIAQRTGLPIRAFEVAASAGLNLNWDRYAYRFG